MAFKRKGSSKKLYIAIFLIVILIVATAAIIYVTQPAPVKAAVVSIVVTHSLITYWVYQI